MEYYLDIQDKNVAEENEDAQFITMEDGEPYLAMEEDSTEEIVLDEKNVIIWDELCRICANSSEHFMPIYDGEGLEHDLHSKIQSYLPFKISQEDSLPLQICYNCAATLISWHDLFKNCLDAQERLTELQNKLNAKEQFCSEQSFENAREEKHFGTVLKIDTDDNEQQIPPQHDKNVEVPDVPEDDRSEHSWNCRKPYKVLAVQADTKDYELAKDKSAVKSSAKKTCQEYLKKEAAEQVPETGRENSKNSKTLKNPSVKIIEDKCLEIDEDNIVASDYDDDNFEDYVPEESKPLVKKTRKRKTREASNATVPSNIVCTKCNKMFRCANSYKIHMHLHTGETPYICHLCGRGFCQPGSLYYHVKHVHQGIKNHACDICGRCFAMKTAMRDHRRIHTGERPFVCDSCKKTFTTKASLYTHSKIHSQEYAFSCSYCKKPFRWRQQMVSHLTTHTKEKNHVCDVCGKAFGVKNELTRHKLTHSSERPFTCSKCGLRYGQKRYLTNHMRTKHKVKATENAATNVSGVKHT